MRQKLFKPDYSHNLVNLSNSILAHFGLSPKHSTLKELDEALNAHNYKNVVLLVMDGMGSDMLKHSLPEESFLRSHIYTDISSVYPPTTTAATTSIYSGLTPKEHGWVGWECYFKDYDTGIVLFRDLDFYKQTPTGTKVGSDFLGYKKLYEQIRETGLCQAYGVAVPWGDFPVVAFEDVCAQIVKLSKTPDKKFIMSYWKQPDGAMHHTGCYSNETRDKMIELNEKIADMAKQLEDTILIITADHGQINVGKSIRINEIKELDSCLRLPPQVEPRAAVFYIKQGCCERFVKEFNQHFANEYLLLTSQEYIAQGYLGEGKEHPKLREFLGDYVALAIGDTIIQYKTQDGVEPVNYIGHHAGLSEKEMLVPLIICAKK